MDFLVETFHTSIYVPIQKKLFSIVHCTQPAAGDDAFYFLESIKRMQKINRQTEQHKKNHANALE
jgi:hypothetical protein